MLTSFIFLKCVLGTYTYTTPKMHSTLKLCKISSLHSRRLKLKFNFKSSTNAWIRTFLCYNSIRSKLETCNLKLDAI